MATVKKGVLVKAGEWWKHLRWTKPDFWGRHRQAEKREANREVLQAELDYQRLKEDRFTYKE